MPRLHQVTAVLQRIYSFSGQLLKRLDSIRQACQLMQRGGDERGIVKALLKRISASEGENAAKILADSIKSLELFVGINVKEESDNLQKVRVQIEKFDQKRAEAYL